LILIGAGAVAVFVASRPESADLAATDLAATDPAATDPAATDPATASYDQAVLADSPIVYWPLVADGEVELRDVVGSRDLVPRDSEEAEFVPTLVDGPRGIGALDLDGSAMQRLDSTFDPNAELGSGSWTLELWMNLEKALVEDSESLFSLIGGWDQERPQRWYLSVRKGRLEVGIGAHGQVFGLDTAVDDGEWHHVVLSYQSDSGDARLFLDAKEVTLEQSPWGSSEELTDAPVAVGAKLYQASGEWQEHWDGGLSRIAIYASILEPERIQAHHRAIVTGSE
jgi:hypothetical protein